MMEDSGHTVAFIFLIGLAALGLGRCSAQADIARDCQKMSAFHLEDKVYDCTERK